MKKRKQTQDASQLSMREIYDLLMYDIEPDLASDNIKYLDVIYEGENEEERGIRLERYRYAFEMFYDRFEHLMRLWKKELVKGKKEMMKYFEATSQGTDDEDLSGLETSIQES
ncbi:hypothetical protein KKC44_02195 [Patescibacteria group bacterium]|nr:hypothetical protein [Patescibacteria group bacterium]MBU2259394.1 hypothetical protein [Patescibacteria group bacterium]